MIFWRAIGVILRKQRRPLMIAQHNISEEWCFVYYSCMIGVGFSTLTEALRYKRMSMTKTIKSSLDQQKIFEQCSKKIWFFIRKHFWPKWSPGHVRFSFENTSQNFLVKVKNIYTWYFSRKKFCPKCSSGLLKLNFWRHQPARNFLSESEKTH